ncbi:putative phage abortive infection protein [Enterobacter ludwigii]|nr:putative phage abortive infection protein [Enterobacter ludwigii]
MNKSIKISSILFVVIGLLIFGYFLLKSSIDGYTIWPSSKTDYTVTGQFGDFVGGVIGTLFALAGTFLIYLTFQEQSKENKRSAFEAVFFEMIRLHRDNVSELRYNITFGQEVDKYENRQVMRVIFKEFIECYREVCKFSNSKNPRDYITKKHLEHLNDIIEKNNLTANPIDLARIDIAYCMVFYGVGEEGEIFLKNLFRKKYNSIYYYKLIYFIKLKPKKTNISRFHNWKTIRDLDLERLKVLIDELYKNRKHPEKTQSLSDFATSLNMHLPYEKYYGGHQFRLGHYFRHLYQSYKYLDNTPFLNNERRYGYGKMLRAQLSTYEQALLLVNSLSNIGMKWELSPEMSSDNKSQQKFITKYNLIKNLPGEQLFGIRYKDYYPNVHYENDEHTL